MKSYVGLEIHIQVKTASKMFCRCSADYFSKEPNINICPVCFGLPGALPVPNKSAFEKAVKLALALNCSVNQSTKFDRKNYFYPDLPKGYQISQYDKPIGFEGYVEIEKDGDSKRIRIQRVHLEEDTGKSTHSESGTDETYLDYNKSGVPLVEVVTYPDFENEEEVILFAKRLRQIVRYLDVSDAEMQKGQMRYELNISTSLEDLPAGQFPNFKVEVKNIGSISVLEKVLHGEIERQLALLEKGEVIKPHTRGLKDMTGETVFQRAKETADDYRYFPEPDIPPIQISDDMLSTLKASIKELPHQRKQRYLELGLENEQADILVEDTERGNWFDTYSDFLIGLPDIKFFAKEGVKWLLGDFSANAEKYKLSWKDFPIHPFSLLRIIELLKDKKITGSHVKKIVEDETELYKNMVDSEDFVEKKKVFREHNRIDQIVKEKGMELIEDSGAIDAFVDEVISANPKIVEDMKKNPNAIKFLVGQVMKLSKGKVNPSVAEEKLKSKLQ